MHATKWLAGTALTGALLLGGVGVVAAQDGLGDNPSSSAAFGECVSGMASNPDHGGIGLHHQTMHPDSEQSVGAHLQEMRLNGCHHTDHMARK
jgi:hypothetical protein